VMMRPQLAYVSSCALQWVSSDQISSSHSIIMHICFTLHVYYLIYVNLTNVCTADNNIPSLHLLALPCPHLYFISLAHTTFYYTNRLHRLTDYIPSMH
jgi:hypothetical protein